MRSSYIGSKSLQTLRKAFVTEFAPFLPYIGVLPVWAELLEVFAVFQDTVHIVPSGSNLTSQCGVHIHV
jgi:hypothetical protein